MRFNNFVKSLLKEANKISNSHFYIRGMDNILEDYQNEQNDCLVLSVDEMPEGTEEIAPLIYKNSQSLLTVEIEGLDPSVDGTENFYIVNNNKVLDTIASFFEDKVVSADNSQYELAKSFGSQIREGRVEFGVDLGKSGFAGEDTGDLKVFLYKTGSIARLKQFLNENV